MESMVLRIFQRQVADQARLGLAGVPLIESGANQGDQDSLWIGVQILIVGTANVAKALWGAGGRREQERQQLRESLGVEGSSALKDVELRNHFEHYDTRIDKWASESPSRVHVDRMVGPPSMISGVTDIDMFRQYDPSTAAVYFWGEKFELGPITAELRRLMPVAEREARRPHWES